MSVPSDKSVKDGASMTTEIEQAAAAYEQVGLALDAAAAHVRTTATHLRAGEFARAWAHAFAGYGFLHRAQVDLDVLAVEHAARSTL